MLDDEVKRLERITWNSVKRTWKEQPIPSGGNFFSSKCGLYPKVYSPIRYTQPWSLVRVCRWRAAELQSAR